MKRLIAAFTAAVVAGGILASAPAGRSKRVRPVVTGPNMEKMMQQAMSQQAVMGLEALTFINAPPYEKNPEIDGTKLYATYATQQWLKAARIDLPLKDGPDFIVVRQSDVENSRRGEFLKIFLGESKKPPPSLQEMISGVVEKFRNPKKYSGLDEIVKDVQKDHPYFDSLFPNSAYFAVADVSKVYSSGIGVLYLPEVELRSEQYAGLLARLPASVHKRLRNIPGLAMDWQGVIALHEAFHAQQFYEVLDKIKASFKKSMSEDRGAEDTFFDFSKTMEIYADQQALRSKYLFLYPAFKDMRALSSLSTKNSSYYEISPQGLNEVKNNGNVFVPLEAHVTHGFLEQALIPADQSARKLDTPVEYRGLLNANAFVNIVLGAQEIQKTLNGQASSRIEDYMRQVKPYLDKKEPQFREIHGFSNAAVGLDEIGRPIGFTNSIKSFGVLETLYNAGAFSEGSPEAVYAGRIISTFDTYLPDVREMPDYMSAAEFAGTIAIPTDMTNEQATAMLETLRSTGDRMLREERMKAFNAIPRRPRRPVWESPRLRYRDKSPPHLLAHEPDQP